jgi:hypothetical protein
MYILFVIILFYLAGILALIFPKKKESPETIVNVLHKDKLC